MKKILVLALTAALLLPLLCACGGDNTPAESSSAAEPSSDAESAVSNDESSEPVSEEGIKPVYETVISLGCSYKTSDEEPRIRIPTIPS